MLAMPRSLCAMKRIETDHLFVVLCVFKLHADGIQMTNRQVAENGNGYWLQCLMYDGTYRLIY